MYVTTIGKNAIRVNTINNNLRAVNVYYSTCLGRYGTGTSTMNVNCSAINIYYTTIGSISSG
ncbi:hypothetical protein [Escherichia coli]|uniref:hypothetical protein n=1 Tax=Escherichia coli TaxID=562 RepID=UPI0021CDFCE5